MKHIGLLIVQGILILGSIFVFPVPEILYTIKLHGLYKRIRIIVEAIGFVVNFVLFFFLKEFMLVVFFSQAILDLIICGIFCIIGKIKGTQRLINIIIEEQLIDKSPIEIRRDILKKYGDVYTIKEINDCIQNKLKKIETQKDMISTKNKES